MPMLRTRAAEVALAALVGAYGIAARTVIPRRARIPANLAVAGASVALARLAGADAANLGLGRGTARRGFRAGLAASVPVVVVTVTAVAWPRTRRFLADEEITATSPRAAAFETLVRVPIETAISEELIFRSALLGLGLHNRSPRAAIAVSSLAFGLWHAQPTWSSVGRGTGGNGGRPPMHHAVGATIAVVLATGVAGAALSALRMRSESVIAPTLVHAALNMTAFAGVRVTT